MQRLVSNQFSVSPGITNDALCSGSLRVQDGNRLSLLMAHIGLGLTSTTKYHIKRNKNDKSQSSPPPHLFVWGANNAYLCQTPPLLSNHPLCSPDCILVVSIDKHLRPNTAAKTLWLLPQLKVLHEAIVHKLSLHVPAAVEGGPVLAPTDALSSHTPLNGRHAARAAELEGRGSV